MKKKIILISLLFCINIFALECNEASFNKGNAEMKQIYSLYNMAVGTLKEQQKMSRSEISRKNYEKQMIVLKNKLVSLDKKKSYLLKAKNINNQNIQTWKSLTKSCKDNYLLAVQKSMKNAKKCMKLLNKEKNQYKFL